MTAANAEREHAEPAGAAAVGRRPAPARRILLWLGLGATLYEIGNIVGSPSFVRLRSGMGIDSDVVVVLISVAVLASLPLAARRPRMSWVLCVGGVLSTVAITPALHRASPGTVRSLGSVDVLVVDSTLGMSAAALCAVAAWWGFLGDPRARRTSWSTIVASLIVLVGVRFAVLLVVFGAPSLFLVRFIGIAVGDLGVPLLSFALGRLLRGASSDGAEAPPGFESVLGWSGVEQRQFAASLHDVASHELAPMVALLERQHRLEASRGDAESAESAEFLHEMAQLGREAIDRLRDLVAALRSEPESGMFRPTRTPADTALDEVALRRSIAAMSWMGAPVEVRVAGLDTEMDRRVAALCWRAIHEGIANAARHAGAAPVSVTLTVEARDVRLTIVNPVGGDTGGLASPDAPLGFGLGLASLTESARRLGGSLAAGRATNHFELRLWVPVHPGVVRRAGAVLSQVVRTVSVGDPVERSRPQPLDRTSMARRVRVATRWIGRSDLGLVALALVGAAGSVVAEAVRGHVTAAPWIDPSSIGRSVLVAIAVVALLVRRRVPVSAMVLGSVTLVATLDQSVPPTLIAVWIILLTVAVTVDSGQRAAARLALVGLQAALVAAAMVVSLVPGDGSSATSRAAANFAFRTMLIAISSLAVWLAGEWLVLRRRRVADVARSHGAARDQGLAAVIAGTASERLRLVGELHAMMAQRLVLLATLSDSARQRLERGESSSLDRDLASITDTCREVRAELDHLVGRLDPNAGATLTAQPSLASALARVQHVRRTGADVRVEVVGDPAEVPAFVGAAIDRLVEALLGSTRLVAATPVQIVVAIDPLAVQLEVRAAAGLVDGPETELGTAIAERVRVAGGTLHLGDPRDRPWRCTVRLPCGADAVDGEPPDRLGSAP
ncbi:MAG: hypothetical protein V9E99_00950 [Microthrixaceae bacterium]|nr:histidine kinase [Microthrixaceae bacterium]